MKNFFWTFLLFITVPFYNLPLFAQFQVPQFGGGDKKVEIEKHAVWSFEKPSGNYKVGDIIEFKLKAKIDDHWHLYSNDFADGGPKVTEIRIDNTNDLKVIGGAKAVGAIKKYDEVFEIDVKYFEKKALFVIKAKITGNQPKLTGTIDYQVCSDETGKCIVSEEEFNFEGIVVKQSSDTVITKTDTTKSDTAASVASVSESTPDTSAKQNPETIKSDLPASDDATNAGGLFGFAILAFLSGLVALLTPCVFPIIPMTVSYFTKTATSRAKGIRDALLYGLFIIIIYTLIGSVVARFNGPEFANYLSTHWLPNVLFFAVFLLFGLSFLGWFEITIPSGLINKIDRQADKGGLLGLFFMAFTLVLASFSCTGPIVGTILVEAAGGSWTKPIVGMFAFSLSFALPFTLFALFPSWLTNLPKSGGWLNSVKVVLGFLELALAIKFLSVADLAYHWNLLDRDVYLSIWIAVFSLMGLYLLGKIKLPHDDPGEVKLSVFRVLMAAVVFSFVVYIIPGLWGAPLKPLAGYLPPLSKQDFKPAADAHASTVVIPNTNCAPAKYSDFLELPHGLTGYFDLEEAKACAKKSGKPVFIDFTGHGCTNCRKMEEYVWAEPQVLKLLSDNFIIASLYVDDKTELPEDKWYTSKFDGKVKKSIGKQNADLQVTMFGANAQPFYVVVSPDGQILSNPIGYESDPAKFSAFLSSGLEKFNSLK